jgi:hypothetical protein
VAVTHPFEAQGGGAAEEISPLRLKDNQPSTSKEISNHHTFQLVYARSFILDFST